MEFSDPFLLDAHVKTPKKITFTAFYQQISLKFSENGRITSTSMKTGRSSSPPFGLHLPLSRSLAHIRDLEMGGVDRKYLKMVELLGTQNLKMLELLESKFA